MPWSHLIVNSLSSYIKTNHKFRQVPKSELYAAELFILRVLFTSENAIMKSFKLLLFISVIVALTCFNVLTK